MSGEELRVGIVCNSLKGGGAEGIAALLTRSWPPSHGEPLLIAVSGRGDLPARELDGTELRILGIDPWPRPGTVVRVLSALRRLTTDEKLTHLVLNSYGLNQAVLLAVRLKLLPQHMTVVVVEHLALRERLLRRLPSSVAQWLATRLLRWLYSATPYRVAVSRGVARDNEALLGLEPGSFTVIANGIDLDRFARARAKDEEDQFSHIFSALPRPIVLGIGRLEPQKNFRLLLEAFARALPAHGSLVILGEGSERRALERSIERLDLVGRAYLPGRLENPGWYLDRADLFVLSSDYEGSPVVLIEALTCGIPIVATDCPWGPAETLSEVISAVLVPTRDPEAMASAISASLLALTTPRQGHELRDARAMALDYARLITDRALGPPRP